MPWLAALEGSFSNDRNFGGAGHRQSRSPPDGRNRQDHSQEQTTAPHQTDHRWRDSPLGPRSWPGMLLSHVVSPMSLGLAGGPMAWSPTAPEQATHPGRSQACCDRQYPPPSPARIKRVRDMYVRTLADRMKDDLDDCDDSPRDHQPRPRCRRRGYHTRHERSDHDTEHD